MKKFLAVIILCVFSIFLWGQTKTSEPPLDFYRAIVEGDLATVKKFFHEIKDIDKYYTLIGHSIYYGIPIEQAIRYGHKDIVNFLISKGAKGRDNEPGYSLFSMAFMANKPEIVELLIKKGAEVNKADNQGYTLLMIAVSRNHEELTKVLINAGADIRKENKKESNLLHFAAESTMYWLVDDLIDLGVDINKKNKLGYTPIQISIAHKNIQMTEYFLKKGAIIEYNEKTLYSACMGDNFEIAKECIKRGIAYDNPDYIWLVVTYGCNEVAKLLIEKGVDPQKNIQEKLPLIHRAAEGNNTYLLKYLLNKGVNVNLLNDELTPLHFAVLYGGGIEAVKILVENGANFTKEDDLGYTPLMHALKIYRKHIYYANQEINKKQLEIIYYLISKGADINYISKDEFLFYNTPFKLAIDTGDEDLVRFFMKKGADPTFVGNDSYSTSPLKIAIESGYLDIVKTIIELSKNKKKGWLDPYIIITGQTNDFAMTKMLLDYGADPNFQNEDGITLLHTAAQTGNLKMINLLLKYSASQEIKDSDYKYPVDYAVNDEIRKILKLDTSKKTKKKDKTEAIISLFSAIKEKKVDDIKKLLRKGIDINILGPGKITPLIAAVKTKDMDLIRFFLKKKADPNIGDGIQRRPIHYAIEQNNLQLVKLLIEKGANPNLYDRDEYTALTKSFDHYSPQIASYLLTLKNIDIQKGSSLNNTPLLFALMRNNIELTMLLLKKGANIHVMNSDGMTPLHLAVYLSNYDLIYYFIKKGIDVNSSDKSLNKEVTYWITPLHIAAENNDFISVNILLEKGANPNLKLSKYRRGKTALHIAAEKGNIKIISLLLKYNADPNILNEKGQSPIDVAQNDECAKLLETAGSKKNTTLEEDLYLAVVYRNIALVKRLLKNGANPNILYEKKSLDIDKNAPLHAACSNRDLLMIRLLVANKADINIQNKAGWTPLHLCAMNIFQIKETKEVILLLLELGADPNIKDKADRLPIDLAENDEIKELLKNAK